jgi:hypothetical protein
MAVSLGALTSDQTSHGFYFPVLLLLMLLVL